VKYRPTGGSSCAPSYDSDSGDDFIYYEDVSAGSQHVRVVSTFQNSGSYLFCMWLSVDYYDWSTTLVGSQTVTFRQPTGSVSFSTSPPSPLINESVTLTFSGASEAPRYLFTKIRPAGGAGCAPTAYSDSGDSLIDGDDVNGSFSFPITQQTRSVDRNLSPSLLQNQPLV
jgi:hypothetical protein